MFCSECGTKNEKGSLFCANCGAKIEAEKESKKVSKSNKPNKPANKNNKTIIIVIAVLVVLGVCYTVGNSMTNPKNVAQKYIQALIDLDGDTLYSYLDIEGDRTFVTKSVFKKILKGMKDDMNVVNFKITKVDYGTGKLSAKVNFSYTTKDSSSELTNSINLVKQKSKKFLVFDNWKVSNMSNSNMVLKNYTIKTLKGSKVNFGGVEVKSKYLNKKKSTSVQDVYVLPQVFMDKTTIEVTLPNGLKIEKEVTPSSYNNEYKVEIDEKSLTKEAKESLINSVKDIIGNVYTNAIAGKTFSEIKSNYEVDGLDLSNLESSYTSFADRLKNASNKLTSITFKDITISDMYMTDKGYLKVEVKVNYDYTVEYTNYNNEVQTSSNSDYDYMTVTLGISKDKYYLVDIYGFDYYFYR